jgi:proteic killer suppression protein
MWKVIWNRKVDRDLRKIPDFIQEKFRSWVVAVEMDGLPITRKRPGLHDEPLKGTRLGQRSVRLNRSYRIIYQEGRQGIIEIAEVLEINKHDY